MEKEAPLVLRTPVSAERADSMLAEAAELNPGSWIAHSQHAAEVARRIASRLPGVDHDLAYACGLLHDIGRRFGVSHLKHTIAGYRYLMQLGLTAVAPICLTHSFPQPDLALYVGRNDCTAEEGEFIASFLKKHQLTIYDKLSIIADAMAGPDGLVILEQRFVDVVVRNGANPSLPVKWRCTLGIKAELELMLGHSLYRLFPEVLRGLLQPSH